MKIDTDVAIDQNASVVRRIIPEKNQIPPDCVVNAPYGFRYRSFRAGLATASKMFQTCGSATLSESERTINASEGSDDHPSVALPLLPRDRYCQAWDVA